MNILHWRYWMGAIVVLTVCGSNCLAQVDSDGDGFTDQQEIFLGTNPNDALSYPGAHTNGFNLATNMIYVAKSGSDSNAGTAVAPFLTIQKAATTAKTKSAAGIGSTITIMPGSYGESILYKADSADLIAPVVFTAATNGTVAITGADVWTNGWSNFSGNIYFHQWTNTWGFGTVPAGGWPGTIHSNADMCLRGEIVLVNGNLYAQVPTQATLTNGSYFVDEPNQRLYVQHRAGVVESSAFYEVTQRTNLLVITKNNGKLVGNIKLQGLEFRMAGDQLVAPAVEVFGATNVLVDTCLFDYNNWVGINFDFGTNITVRNSVASHNGAMGMQMGNTETNIVIDGCETDFNNWRGYPANFTGFAIAGIKLLKIHTALIRNHIALGNFTYGLWFDFDNQNIFLDGCVHAGNELTGLQFEATPGPVWIQNGITMRGYGKDGQLGLLAQNTEKLTVTNYAIFSSMNVNGSGAMGCTVSTSRIVTNWATLVPVTLFSSNWTLKDNMFRFGGGFQYAIDMFTNFPSFTNTLSSDFNHFCNFFQYTNVFTLNGSKGGSAWKTNFVQWQTLTGQDLHSESNNIQRLCTVTQDTFILPGSATAHGPATNAICDTAPDGAGALNNVVLLKFDTSSLTNIPREAELKLTAINVNVNSNSPIFAVYRMKTDWDENATGLQAKSGASWHDGGSFNASDYDPTPIRFGQCITNIIDFGTFNTFVDVTPVAQQWAAGTAPNFGVAIIAEPTWDQPVADGSNYRKFEILTHNTTLTNVWPVLAAQEGQTAAGGCPAITVSPPTLPNAIANIPYSGSITAAGSSATPFTFTNIGALPSGMTLSSQGTLSGTATMSGTTVFTVKATDTNNCFGSNVYTFVVQAGCSTINVAPTLLPTGTVNWVYSGVVTGSGGTFPYTFTSAGTLPGGVSMNGGGVFSGRATAAGSFTFNVKATDSGGVCAGSNNVTIVISSTATCPPITLSPAGLLATATVSVAYGPQSITASGGNGLYSYAKTAGTLPPGLTVSSGGILSGTPTSTGSFGFTVTATDTNSCVGSTNYTLVVACPTITLPSSVLATGRVGVVYNTQTITATGGTGPYVFTNIVGTLPPGLILSSGGTITGTPTLNVTNTFTVRATDQDGCIGSNNYTIVIQPVCTAITVLPTLFPTGTVGTAYSQTNTASGGSGSYTFTVIGGSVPSGLDLSTDGVLSGIPLTDGTSVFTVQAADDNTGCTGSTNCTLVTKLGVGAVFLNFNTGTTDFTGNFNSNGGVFTWNSTIGVTNSGGVKSSTTDETAIYRSNRWNLSTNGASVTLSSFIRSTNSGASVQNALGVSTTTNGQFKSTSTGSWLTFFISTQSGFNQAKMGYQYRSQGTTSLNSNLASFVLLSTNWYKWSVTFTTTNGASGLGTGNVTLENYGPKGTNSPSTVVQTNGVSFGAALQDVFQSKTNYPGIRAWTASGMAGFDNWSVTAP